MRTPRFLTSILATAVAVGLTIAGTGAPSGGAQLNLRPNLGTQTLQQISMVTPNYGYGLFTASGDGRCEVVVGKTNNAGRTFGSQVVVERWDCGSGYVGAEAISTAGLFDVFVWGRGLWASHDGGATWTAVPHIGHVLDVATARAAFGPPQPDTALWLVSAVCATPKATVCPLRIERSTDQGWTWTEPKAQPYGAQSETYVAPALGTSPLVRVSTDVSYVVSTGATPSPTKGERMWVTTDGGTSWHQRFIHCVDNPQSVVLAADPNGLLIAVCGYGPSAGYQGKSVSISTNEGSSWHVYGACGPPPHINRNLLPICQGYLGEVVAPVPGTVFETGCRSNVNVSRDGGVRWATIRPLIGNVAGCIAQIDFVNQVDGFVLGALSTTGQTAIWVTSDRGRKWTIHLPTVGFSASPVPVLRSAALDEPHPSAVR